jgi:Polymer-forming cytoskeletal
MGKEGEDQMFGTAKGSARDKDDQLPPAPRLQDSTPLNLAESDSMEISCIGPGMTVVGKISSEGTLNVFGRVEGELHASIVRISNGARVEGTIAAQELTIGGRFKGTIQADRGLVLRSSRARYSIAPWQLRKTLGSLERRARRIPQRARRRIHRLLFSLCRWTETARSTVGWRCMPNAALIDCPMRWIYTLSRCVMIAPTGGIFGLASGASAHSAGPSEKSSWLLGNFAENAPIRPN